MLKENKGFTLVEVVVSLVIVSLVLVIATRLVSNTLSATENTTYKLMKNNIIEASSRYISECTNGIIDCDFDYDTNSTFSASVLKQYGYFNNLNSPIDNRYLGDCLILKAILENGVIVTTLDDKCY